LAREKPQKKKIIPARETLERLRDGNRRFVSNVQSLETLLTHTRRAEYSLETGIVDFFDIPEVV